MSLLLALLAQIGPFSGAPSIPRPAVEGREGTRPRATAKAAPRISPPPRPSRMQLCLAQAESEPEQAAASANGWLANAAGSARVLPYQCLGTAQSNLSQWSAAEQSFTAARLAASASDRTLRAQLGAMAANAALAGGGAERALPLLDEASADAAAAGNIQLAGEVAIDRARALVALGRNDEAARALVEARTSAANNPLGWLLSATLSRRMGKLAEAQAQIGTAAALQPDNSAIGPEIGLEAGVIAVLAGQTEAARKSWQSVIDLASASEAAVTARSYLAQLPAKAEIKQ